MQKQYDVIVKTALKMLILEVRMPGPADSNSLGFFFLGLDEFCAYVRANTARYTRSWSDDRGANVV